MQKKVLSEIDLYIDTVQVIKIDRNKLKNDIFNSFVSEKRLSNNKKDYSYHDFKIPFSKPLGWLSAYLRDHFRADYHRTLIGKNEWGNIYNQY